ncbi:MAG: hypothetical protein ACLPS1_28820 [Streptosporangiaceae bacterium]
MTIQLVAAVRVTMRYLPNVTRRRTGCTATTAAAGPPRLRRPAESHFAALTRAIVYQQLAGVVAAAIHGRLIAALGNEVTPQRLLALPDGALRTAGLSAAQAASLRDLAVKVLDATPTARELEPLGDPYRPYRSVLAWYCRGIRSRRRPAQ